MENNNTLIREQLAQVQDQLAQSEARHQEQQQQAEARHQQQLDTCLTRMNAMFAQLNSGTPYSDLSQVPNKCYLAKHIELACNALLCDINTMPLIYSGWQCLMGTVRNENVNSQVKQLQPFVITYKTILHIK